MPKYNSLGEGGRAEQSVGLPSGEGDLKRFGVGDWCCPVTIDWRRPNLSHQTFLAPTTTKASQECVIWSCAGKQRVGWPIYSPFKPPFRLVSCCATTNDDDEDVE